jgi:choline dehydrogenase-like flavoprotein
VVGPDFQHHHVRGLFVADSSVFPGNLGVNPQLPIMVLAARCADAIEPGGVVGSRAR